MSNAFDPSMSIGPGRQTIAPAGPSAADTLPSIDFGFEDLRERMAKFTAKFDAFIEQGRKRVLEERNQFRVNMAELQGMRRRKAAGCWDTPRKCHYQDTNYPRLQRTSE